MLRREVVRKVAKRSWSWMANEVQLNRQSFQNSSVSHTRNFWWEPFGVGVGGWLLSEGSRLGSEKPLASSHVFPSLADFGQVPGELSVLIQHPPPSSSIIVMKISVSWVAEALFKSVICNLLLSQMLSKLTGSPLGLCCPVPWDDLRLRAFAPDVTCFSPVSVLPVELWAGCWWLSMPYKSKWK